MPSILHRSPAKSKQGHSKAMRREIRELKIKSPRLELSSQQIDSLAEREMARWNSDERRVLEAFEQKKAEFIEKERAEKQEKESANERLVNEKKRLELAIEMRKDALKAANQRLLIAKNGFIEIDDPRDKDKKKEERRKIKVRYRKDWLRDPKKGGRFLLTHLTIRLIQYALIPYAVLISKWPEGRVAGQFRSSFFMPSKWMEKFSDQRRSVIGMNAKEAQESIDGINKQMAKDLAELAKKEAEIKKGQK